jgi:hypothetical protein
LIWYELPRDSEDPLFENPQLEEKWPQIEFLLQEKHPIFTQAIPDNALAELSKLKEMRTLEEALGFSIRVGKIEYDELGSVDIW